MSNSTYEGVKNVDTNEVIIFILFILFMFFVESLGQIYGKNSKNNEISFLGNNFRSAWYCICDIKERMDIN